MTEDVKQRQRKARVAGETNPKHTARSVYLLVRCWSGCDLWSDLHVLYFRYFKGKCSENSGHEQTWLGQALQSENHVLQSFDRACLAAGGRARPIRGCLAGLLNNREH